MQNPFGSFSVMHEGGLQLGKTIAVYGAGFSIGKNIVRVIRGKVRGSVAIANVIRDTAIFFGVSYLGGAFFNGALQMTGNATSAVSPIDAGLSTVGMSNGSELGNTASELSWAANDLINRVTNGLFGLMGSATTNVGGKLTQATSDTALGGTVSTVVGTFGAAGSLFGDTAAAMIPAVLFGLIVGVIFGLIFDR